MKSNKSWYQSVNQCSWVESCKLTSPSRLLRGEANESCQERVVTQATNSDKVTSPSRPERRLTSLWTYNVWKKRNEKHNSLCLVLVFLSPLSLSVWVCHVGHTDRIGSASTPEHTWDSSANYPPATLQYLNPSSAPNWSNCLLWTVVTVLVFLLACTASYLPASR